MMVAILRAAKAQQEVAITRLEDNPGILPFKIGLAKLVDYEHSFIHSIDLSDIEQSIRTIILQKNQLDNLESKFKDVV